MGFDLCKMEPGIWLRSYGEDHYEYIAACVETQLVTSKHAKSMIDVLSNTYYFKLKGTGPISYNLGCDFGRDDDVNLHFHLKSALIQWFIVATTSLVLNPSSTSLCL